MEQGASFVYTYSASVHAEVQEIRRKYLPQPESKLEELKRLDARVQKAGAIESIAMGTLGTLVLGTGMCLAMQIIASGAAAIAGGVVLGIFGIGGILAAYPIQQKCYRTMKARLTPRILELAQQMGSY